MLHAFWKTLESGIASEFFFECLIIRRKRRKCSSSSFKASGWRYRHSHRLTVEDQLFCAVLANGIWIVGILHYGEAKAT